MNLYPVCLKLDKKDVCVIGGGSVACRKVKVLLKSTDRITVISPELCRTMQGMLKKNNFVYKKSVYRRQLIKNAFLVIAATDDNDVNTLIARDCFDMGKLINVVDVPGQCDFYLPSVIDRKGILLSISTQGQFPGLAKKLRREITGTVDAYSAALKVFAGIRNQIKQQCKSAVLKKKLLRGMLDDDTLRMVGEGRISDLDDLKRFLKIK